MRASCLSASRASTFEEDKFAVVALVGGVDVAGEADPEDGYGHGVVIQDPVPPHTPEPATLHHKAKLHVYLTSDLFIFASSVRSPGSPQRSDSSTILSYPGLGVVQTTGDTLSVAQEFTSTTLRLHKYAPSGFFFSLFLFTSHLENKHLPPQHGHRVEIPIANIRGLVFGKRCRSIWRLRRSRGRVVFSDARRRGFSFRQGGGGGGGSSRGGGSKRRRRSSRSGLRPSRGTVCRIWRFWRGISGRGMGAGGGGDVGGGGRAGLLIRGARGGRWSTSGKGRT